MKGNQNNMDRPEMKNSEFFARFLEWCWQSGIDITLRGWGRFPVIPGAFIELVLRSGDRNKMITAENFDVLTEILRISYKKIFMDLCCQPLELGELRENSKR